MGVDLKYDMPIISKTVPAITIMPVFASLDNFKRMGFQLPTKLRNIFGGDFNLRLKSIGGPKGLEIIPIKKGHCETMTLYDISFALL
jgi:hypothetical protein